MPPFLDAICPDATLADIDRLALEDFLEPLRLPRPALEYLKPGVSIETVATPLVGLRQLAPGTAEPAPTRLVLLLFGHTPTRFLRGARVVLAVYEGNTRAAIHSQRFDAEGPIPKLLRDTRDKLRFYTGLAIDKSSGVGGRTANRPRYSQRALDEAVVNAIAHRDYESSDPIPITVFTDRIEITNPGGLVPGLDIQRVREGGSAPSWRNPSLASFLLRLGAAQTLGQGIPTILQETLATAGKPAVIIVEPGRFTVVLPALQPAISPGTPPLLRGELAGSQRDGLILISIGGESVRPVVDSSLAELGLSEADVLIDHASPGYVDPDAQRWEEEARIVRDAVRRCVEDTRYGRFHLFYRGPVALAPLLGALIAPNKPLVVYYHEAGRYRQAMTLDRRFLVAKE
ncbi:ATP-binding protein [Sorangium sp. So ce1036]|uniref:ATP-binding protein n=1 Tax=Sorangium sp. So ce1036 TaxID=3133328 RepID=UPI003F0BD9FD